MSTLSFTPAEWIKTVIEMTGLSEAKIIIAYRLLYTEPDVFGTLLWEVNVLAYNGCLSEKEQIMIKEAEKKFIKQKRIEAYGEKA